MSFMFCIILFYNNSPFSYKAIDDFHYKTIDILISALQLPHAVR